jgi:hypothetical protein
MGRCSSTFISGTRLFDSLTSKERMMPMGSRAILGESGKPGTNTMGREANLQDLIGMRMTCHRACRDDGRLILQEHVDNWSDDCPLCGNPVIPLTQDEYRSVRHGHPG